MGLPCLHHLNPSGIAQYQRRLKDVKLHRDQHPYCPVRDPTSVLPLGTAPESGRESGQRHIEGEHPHMGWWIRRVTFVNQALVFR